MLEISTAYDQRLYSLLKRLDTRLWAALLGTLLWGTLAHGMVFFNKFAFHDEIHYLFDVGATFTSGRWFLGVLEKLVSFLLYPTDHYSLPLINGVVTLLCVSLLAYSFIRAANIQNRCICFLLSGIFAAYPSMASMFGYMFTAPYYGIAMAMVACGAILIGEVRKWYGFLSGIVLIGCALGIYQAYIPVALCLFLFYFLTDIDRADTWTAKALVKHIFYFGTACLGFMAVYFAGNKFFLAHYRLSLSGYLGISSMGQEGILTYLSRAKEAYLQSLLLYKQDASAAMGAALPGRPLFILSVLLCAGRLYRAFRRGALRGITMTVLVLLLPLAAGFIYVMTDPTNVHTLMIYGNIALFVCSAWLLDAATGLPGKLRECCVWAGIACIIVMGGIFCRFDNACYLKAEIVQQQTISYSTSLITQIKSAEGYRDEYPVVFLNENDIHDHNFIIISEFDVPSINPYQNMDQLVNNNGWKDFLRIWCGFNPTFGDPSDFETLPEVADMPHYPDQGSILVIHDTVVVKF